MPKEPRDRRRPNWILGVKAGQWQPEGASQWVARGEYLMTLQELARGATAPRIREAFRALDRLADASPEAGRSQSLAQWAAAYGFLDAWLVEIWANTLDWWCADPEARSGWEIAWPTLTYFDEQAELGAPKRTFTHFRWLALSQVGRLTYAQIAEHEQGEAGLDLSTISRAITATASLIGITLRPAPRRP